MRMRGTGMLLLLAWMSTCGGVQAVAQEMGATAGREVKIAGVGGAPSFVLKISARGRQGKVEVRNEKGAEVQELACLLLRDSAAPTESELAAVREQFVERFEAKDLDFDGHPDLAGIRAFGAKWAQYCVWLYDAQQHIFVKDFLAEQMELLTNLAPEKNGRWIVASSVGPTNPWRAVYRIFAGKHSMPGRQLLPISSCSVETTPGGESPKAIWITRFEKEEVMVRRQDAGEMDKKAADQVCVEKE
jgi:hypothetical protein